jgi:hypothetical protein
MQKTTWSATELTPALLHEWFLYNPSTGLLHWRKSTFRKGKPGKVAGTIKGDPNAPRYYIVGLMKRYIRAHRAIWIMHHGPIPSGMNIDHIDGNGLNNRLDNLRLCTQADNLKNLAKRRGSKLDHVTGVYPHSQNKGRWRAIIGTRHIGSYSTQEEAIVARRAAEIEYGYSPTHGRREPLAA